MIREGHDDVNFFTGIEIEQSPAFKCTTLFVVGLQDVAQIQYQIDSYNHKHKVPIEHVYFGANMSFPQLNYDSQEWDKWVSMIQPFLDKMYWCSLDVDVRSVEGFLETGLSEHALFIPMISIKLPYVQQLGYNATIKIDDKDFNSTNPGVWCHNLHDLLNRKHFTSWKEYTKDETL